MIDFACGKCGTRFSVAEANAGRQGTCKTCGASITVPAVTRPAPVASPPPPPVAPPPLPEVDGLTPLPSPAPVSLPKGSSVRARRLEADARQMAAAFHGFPLIQINRVIGNPPEVYHVQYNVSGLARSPNGPTVRFSHVAEIQLTLDYPRQAPKCKMLTPVFHPNIEPAVICVGDHWTAGEKLVDLVVRIGEMITFQAYNIKSPLDGEAAMWAETNSHRLPVDVRNLHPAG